LELLSESGLKIESLLFPRNNRFHHGYADVDQTTLYDEEFEEPIVAEDEPSDDVLAILTRQDAVNRRGTCAFHYGCTLHPRESSFYCT
jgi:hypothetical protein